VRCGRSPLLCLLEQGLGFGVISFSPAQSGTNQQVVCRQHKQIRVVAPRVWRFVSLQAMQHWGNRRWRVAMPVPDHRQQEWHDAAAAPQHIVGGVNWPGWCLASAFVRQKGIGPCLACCRTCCVLCGAMAPGLSPAQKYMPCVSRSVPQQLPTPNSIGSSQLLSHSIIRLHPTGAPVSQLTEAVR
jgi:hypothetical protein